jgi:hypothetical protein
MMRRVCGLGWRVEVTGGALNPPLMMRGHYNDAMI